jgi:hypothetical protein
MSFITDNSSADVPNRSAIQEWVNLLRSDEFSQIKRHLGTCGRNERCALGVACEVAVTHKITERLEDMPPGGKLFFGTDYTTGDWQGVPEPVQDFFKISMKSFKIVATLNDISGLSFSEIADHLEKRYLS